MVGSHYPLVNTWRVREPFVFTRTMMALAILLAGAASDALAAYGSHPTPEVGLTSAGGAVSLLAGAVLVLRSRRRP